MRRKHIFGGIFGGGSLARRRGSVLLMVIGLLTILALLGSTFLFVARSYRKTSKALTYRYQATPLASGSLTRVVQLLKEDLRIDDNGTPLNPADDAPYNATAAGSAGWVQFVDYPAIGPDDWLANIDPVSGVWPHITNLFTSNSPYIENHRAVGDSYLVDSDGDGIRDAYYGVGNGDFEAKVMNELGEKYYVGVRVIDLGGLINVNTAAENGESGATLPTFYSPVNLNLREFLKILPADYSKYTALQASRCNGAAVTDLAGFFTNDASRLLQPATPYSPFAIGDEMYLRYLDTDGLMNTGRLFETSPLTANLKKYLTTFNCSRNLVRHPETNLQLRINLREPTSLDDINVRQALYDALVKAAGGATATDPDKKKATHVVANIWAYLDGQDSLKAYDFTATGAYALATPYTAYGVVPQSVFSEAYAKSKNDASGVFEQEVQAVEIYNPTGSALVNYKLLDNSDANITSFATLGTGFTYVLTENGTISGGFFTPVGGTEIKISGVDFLSGKKVKLVRNATLSGGGTVDILMDEIDLTYARPATGAGYENAIEESDKRTDTDTDRARYNVATYATPSGHTIGGGNNLTATDLTAAIPPEVYQGFDIKSKSTANGIITVAELLNNFTTGSSLEGTAKKAFPQELEVFKDVASRGRLDLDDGVLCTGDSYPDTCPWAGILAELFHVIPADNTRLDEGPPTSGNHSRVYGRVNINTAPWIVLKNLPWPSTVNGVTIDDTAKGAIATYIIDYRDKKAVLYDYSGRSGVEGFMSPAEISIPLIQYAKDNLMGGGLVVSDADYVAVRDSLYIPVSNLITVNSDVYAVYIYVKANEEGAAGTADAKSGCEWRYIAVIDRSNCRAVDDTPAVLLFSELK